MEISSHILPPMSSDPRIPIRSLDRSDNGNESNMNVAAQNNPLPQSTIALTVEQTIRNTRARLEQHLNQNTTSSEETLQLAMDVVNIPCPLGVKYAKLDIPELLRQNYNLQGPNTLPALKSALGILGKYGGNLLRENRPSVWRCVRFSNEIFRTKVDNVDGSREILKLLGYTQEIEDGLAYPDEIEEPNLEDVTKISADIIIARCEVDAVMNNTHQNPDSVKQYLGGLNTHGQVRSAQDLLTSRPLGTPPKGIVAGGIALPGMVSVPPNSKSKLSASPANGKTGLSTITNEKQHVLIPQSVTTDAPTSTSPNSSSSSDNIPGLKRPETLPVPLPRPSSVSDSQISEQKYVPITPPSVAPKPIPTREVTREPKPKKKIAEVNLCDLCGNSAATKACDTCGNKQCENCDELWHKHPARKEHNRKEIIPDVPSPVNEESVLIAKEDDTVFSNSKTRPVARSRSDVNLSSDKRPTPAPRQRIRTDPMTNYKALSPGDQQLRAHTLPRQQPFNEYPHIDRRSQTMKKPTPPPKPERPLSVGNYSGKSPSGLTTPTNFTQGSSPIPYPLNTPDFYSPEKIPQSPGEVLLSADEEKRLTLTREIKNVDIEMTRKKIEQLMKQQSDLVRDNQFAKQTSFYHELDQRLATEKDKLETLVQEKQKIEFTLSTHLHNRRKSFGGEPGHPQHSLPPTVKLPPYDNYSPYMGNPTPYMDREGQQMPWMTGNPATMHNIPSPGYQQISSEQRLGYGQGFGGQTTYGNISPSQRVQNGVCRKCRYLNSVGSTICNNCKTSLVSGEPTENKLHQDLRQLDIQPKECANCGMLNKADSMKCSVCFMPLILSPSYNEVMRDKGYPPPPVNRMVDVANAPHVNRPPVDQLKSPPPTKPNLQDGNQAWACEHCTFLNTDPNTRVCAICDKTTTSIPLKKKPELKPKPLIGNGKTQSQSTSQVKVSSPGAGPENKSPMTEQNVTTRFVSMQEEQEQVLIEKLQAKKEWEQQLKREEEEEKQRLKENKKFPKKTESVLAAAATTGEAAKPAAVEKPTVKPNKLDVSKWEQQHLDNLDAEKEHQRKNWQKQDAAAQHLREKKLQEEQRTDGLRFINLLREAEGLDYKTEELEIAMQLCESKNPLKWLQEDWVHRIETVVALVAHEQDKGKPAGLNGEMSLSESKEALLMYQGDVAKAVEECKKQRGEKIDEIAELGGYSRDEVAEALRQNKGDAEKALLDLNKRILQPFLERLWQSEEFDITQSDICRGDASMERRVRMVLAKYDMPSWGRAQTAIRLIDIGKYEVEDAIIAAKECGTADRAMEFLEKTCEICFDTVPMNKLHTLIHCQCKICRSCMVDYFNIQIREKNIRQCTCPYCDQPDMEDQETADQYFQFLDTMVKYLLDEETHTLFQQKLRDLYLMKDPNFRWCSHCDFGFLNDRPERLKMRCPECHEHTCFKCKKHWLDQHEGITCEQFQRWKEENDPDHQAAGLAAHLKENGIDCPNCKFRYALAKGGCMHFKCSQCRHEFCSGCNQPFKNKCTQFKSCAKKGLHAHHPRLCLFYLRDVDIKDLQKLLQDNNVHFDTMPPQLIPQHADNEEEGAAARLPDEGKCRVEEQKETNDGLKDDFCGRDAEQGFAGLCKLHYSEYLVELIKNNHIDPAVMMTADELKTILWRNEIKVPERGKKESVAQYTHKLLELIQQRLPLENPN
ncbi:uncharacterized protein LOC144437543 isoform X2 [Glandiceps talaboti]